MINEMLVKVICTLVAVPTRLVRMGCPQSLTFALAMAFTVLAMLLIFFLPIGQMLAQALAFFFFASVFLPMFTWILLADLKRFSPDESIEAKSDNQTDQ